MKKTIYPFLILFAFLSCSKDEPICTDAAQTIPHETLGTFGFYSITSGSITKNTMSFAIRSQAELERYTDMEEYPSIDFEKYFVIVGRHAYGCLLFNSQEVLTSCNKLHFNVYINQLDCNAIVPVNFSAILPIEYADFQVQIDILDGE